MATPRILIIDNGGYQIRAGYAGEAQPTIIAPNMVARMKRQLRLLIGDEIEYKIKDSSQLQIYRPISKGYVLDTTVQNLIWDRVITQLFQSVQNSLTKLHSSSSSSSSSVSSSIPFRLENTILILTVPPFLPFTALYHLDTLVMEHYPFAGYLRCTSTELALYSFRGKPLSLSSSSSSLSSSSSSSSSVPDTSMVSPAAQRTKSFHNTVQSSSSSSSSSTTSPIPTNIATPVHQLTTLASSSSSSTTIVSPSARAIEKSLSLSVENNVPWDGKRIAPNVPREDCHTMFPFLWNGTGILIDFGFSNTWITPIIRWEPYWSGVRKLDIGGKVLTNALKECLSYRQFNLMDDTNLVNMVKEQLSYTALDFTTELAVSKTLSLPHILQRYHHLVPFQQPQQHQLHPIPSHKETKISGNFSSMLAPYLVSRSLSNSHSRLHPVPIHDGTGIHIRREFILPDYLHIIKGYVKGSLKDPARMNGSIVPSVPNTINSTSTKFSTVATGTTLTLTTTTTENLEIDETTVPSAKRSRPNPDDPSGTTVTQTIVSSSSSSSSSSRSDKKFVVKDSKVVQTSSSAAKKRKKNDDDETKDNEDEENEPDTDTDTLTDTGSSRSEDDEESSSEDDTKGNDKKGKKDSDYRMKPSVASSSTTTEPVRRGSARASKAGVSALTKSMKYEGLIDNDDDEGGGDEGNLMNDTNGNNRTFIRTNPSSMHTGNHTNGITEDTQILIVNHERFTIPEAYFRPSDIGIQQKSLPETIKEVIEHCPKGDQYTLWSSIILIGGGANIPGLEMRLYAELRSLLPHGLDCMLYTPENPTLTAWQGGSIYGCQDYEQLQKVIVTREEYTQNGPDICLQKFSAHGNGYTSEGPATPLINERVRKRKEQEEYDEYQRLRKLEEQERLYALSLASTGTNTMVVEGDTVGGSSTGNTAASNPLLNDGILSITETTTTLGSKGANTGTNRRSRGRGK